jgi:hypothetical protein
MKVKQKVTERNKEDDGDNIVREKQENLSTKETLPDLETKT